MKILKDFVHTFIFASLLLGELDNFIYRLISAWLK
jgi:hypothetical protein